jgi:hypothetical protein
MDELDELESIRRRRATEHRHGNVRKACERAGVSSTTFQTAIRKTRFAYLTDKEFRVIKAYIAVLDEQNAEIEALRKSL